MLQTFFCPSDITFGSGALDKLAAIKEEYGKKVFVVMGKSFRGKEVEKRVLDLLSGCEVEIYSEVKPNPRDADINAGAKICSEFGADFIVALGGGSTIDSAKAINIVVTNGGSAWDYTKGADRSPKPITKPLLPFVAVPTTAGTGTEATRYSVVTNSETHDKATIKTDLIFPNKSLVDPDLMISVPKMTTALTGIDAFAHAFEAYIGPKATDISEMFSLKAIKLFAENIKAVCEDGNNVEARTNMALCSTLGGLSISHSATTLPHGIGQALSGVTDAPHGGSIAVCLPNIVRWTLPEGEKKFADVACIFKPELEGKSVKEQAQALPDILEELFGVIMGKKLTMADYGLTADKVEAVADMALKQYNGDVSRHPKVATRDDLIYLINQSL